MPRLSNSTYLLIHHHLRQDWLAQSRIYSLIPPKDQRYIHDFFRPSEHLTDEELLAHRRAISKEQPSLPHCAGRAVHRMVNPVNHPELVRGRIRAYPVLRPQVDVEKFTRALLMTAREIQDRQDDSTDPKTSSGRRAS